MGDDAGQLEDATVTVAAGAGGDAPGEGSAPVRWGVLGATARVAQRLVLPALSSSPAADLVAVASQSHSDAAGYDTFGAGRAYGRYDELLADDAVEAVYVAVPTGLHAEWTVRAALAGKHVLCERPLATVAPEGQEAVEACEEAGVVLMEADTLPFHPVTVALEDMVRSRRLGRLRFARAASTVVLEDPEDFRWRPETGGGALLDLGVPCLGLLLLAAGRPPLRVAAAGRLARTGVDTSFSGWLDFGLGLTGSFECSFEAPPRQSFEIVGTEAAVSVEDVFGGPPGEGGLDMARRDGHRQPVDVGGGDAVREMVDHVAAVLRGAATPRRTAAQSVQLLALADQLREAAHWEFL